MRNDRPLPVSVGIMSHRLVALETQQSRSYRQILPDPSEFPCFESYDRIAIRRYLRLAGLNRIAIRASRYATMSVAELSRELQRRRTG